MPYIRRMTVGLRLGWLGLCHHLEGVLLEYVAFELFGVGLEVVDVLGVLALLSVGLLLWSCR
jgi:hypothetical protein